MIVLFQLHTFHNFYHFYIHIFIIKNTKMSILFIQKYHEIHCTFQLHKKHRAITRKLPSKHSETTNILLHYFYTYLHLFTLIYTTFTLLLHYIRYTLIHNCEKPTIIPHKKKHQGMLDHELLAYAFQYHSLKEELYPVLPNNTIIHLFISIFTYKHTQKTHTNTY